MVDRKDLKRVQLDFSGSLSIEGMITANDLISAAGQLTIEKRTDNPLEIWGAAKLDFTTDNSGLSFLKDAGLEADANILIGLNFGSEDKTVDLALPGRPVESIAIPEDTVMFEAQGSLTFNKSTADLLGDNDQFNVASTSNSTARSRSWSACMTTNPRCATIRSTSNCSWPRGFRRA